MSEDKPKETGLGPLPAETDLQNEKTHANIAMGPTTVEPLYVNPKQYHRIQIRRQQREALSKRMKVIPKKKDGYQYLSRHKHAVKRKRGPGGRFLTKAELALMEAQEASKKVDAGGS